MTAFWAILLGGIGTYLMRASFLGIIGGGVLPPAVEKSLRYVGPAVFAAIVAPRVLGDPGMAAFADWPTARMVAALATGILVWKTRNVPAALGFGMVALWSLQAVGLT